MRLLRWLLRKFKTTMRAYRYKWFEVLESFLAHVEKEIREERIEIERELYELRSRQTTVPVAMVVSQH